MIVELSDLELRRRKTKLTWKQQLIGSEQQLPPLNQLTIPQTLCQDEVQIYKHTYHKKRVFKIIISPYHFHAFPQLKFNSEMKIEIDV